MKAGRRYRTHDEDEKEKEREMNHVIIMGSRGYTKNYGGWETLVPKAIVPLLREKNK